MTPEERQAALDRRGARARAIIQDSVKGVTLARDRGYSFDLCWAAIHQQLQDGVVGEHRDAAIFELAAFAIAELAWVLSSSQHAGS